MTAGDDLPVPFGLPIRLGMGCAVPFVVPPEALLGVTLAVAVLDMEGSNTFPVWAAVVCFCIGMATGYSMKNKECVLLVC